MGDTHTCNPWNVLDFVIVVISIVYIITGPLSHGALPTFCNATASAASASLKSLRSLRALRALRPLRVVKRFPQLKLVVNSIFMALPQIITVR